jgi:hypothetical protein
MKSDAEVKLFGVLIVYFNENKRGALKKKELWQG